MTPDFEKLLSQLTLEEKISLLAGADQWHTVLLERPGIPVLKMTDGPNGARGADGSMGPTSACFPAGVALAATWNSELVEQVGRALGEETKAKGAHLLLAPTVNIHRSPLAGRSFECFSEDPFLASRMAVAYIRGLQSRGVGACIKHFVCNDSDFQRRSISSEVEERPLREIYLAPFQAAVREAQPWAVMSSYNKVNGVSASENPYLLREILRNEWGFDGLVVSDWYGTYSPRVAGDGVDLEMPGPARWMGGTALREVREGRVSETVIDEKVRRLLRTMQKAGCFENPELQPEQSIDKPEHRKLARQAAGEAAVLLKNEAGLLPLDLKKIKSIAVIGQNAKWPQIVGGGSASVTPHYKVSPLEGIRRAAGDAVRVEYAAGCDIQRKPPLLDAEWLADENGRRGLAVEFFANSSLSGDPVNRMFLERTAVTFNDGMLTGVDPHRYSARMTARFTAPESGSFSFALEGSGASRLFVDDAEVVDCWTDRPASTIEYLVPEKRGAIDLQAGRTYRLRIEFASETPSPRDFLLIRCQPPTPADSIRQAAVLAARSDAAIIFAGLTSDWESEGGDRTDMELRGPQAELIEQVTAANPRTIVVLNTGAPVALPWLEKIPALLQAWYAGQEAGNAVADVLFGAVNPSGKLPMTFPKRLQDTPAFINYPGEGGRVVYGEGLFVGYRYYDAKDVDPLFPFGYGLSYTAFAYRNLELDAAAYETGKPINVRLELENTGARAGQEVVQLYIRDIAASVARPEKELKAFAKIALAAGEKRTVSFRLDESALAFYDPDRKRWTAEAGTFEVLVGASSRDIRLRKRFEWKLRPARAGKPRLSAALSLRALLEDEGARLVLEKYFYDFLMHPYREAMLDMTLEQFIRLFPDKAGKLQDINAELAAI